MKKMYNIPPLPTLTKIDDVPTGSYVEKDDYVTYTISFDYNKPNAPDIDNAVLVDYLPQEIANYDVYPSSYGVYDADTHTVTWNLETLSQGDSNTFTLRVRVGQIYESWSKAVNVCKIMDDSTVYAIATEKTQLGLGVRVCNLTQGTWFNLIQEAVDDANSGDIIQAWPGVYEENIDISGKSLTLKGIDPNNWAVVSDTVIKGVNTSSYPVYLYNDSLNNIISVIKGFTIIHGVEGIYLYSEIPNNSVEISNCIIEKNNDSGIHAFGFETKISNCVVRNSEYGILTEAYSASARPKHVIRKTIIEDNTYGIYVTYCDPCIISCVISGNDMYGIYGLGDNDFGVIKNNILYNNGSNFYPQISLNSFTDDTLIRNNTIVCQNGYGIELYPAEPKIINCIIWCEHPLSDTGYDVTYSCVKYGYYGEGNRNDDPIFYDVDSNNFHLTENSPCKNKGDANEIPENETDIDGEERVIYGNVDLGADEFFRSHADLDKDGDVEFLDYCILANNWLEEDCSGSNWCNGCDIDHSDTVDADDLELFCNDWLWIAGWLDGWMFQNYGQQMMMQQQQQQNMLILSETMALESESMTQLAQTQVVITEQDIEESVDWLDSLWINGDLNNLSESEFQQFRESVENSPL